MKNEVIAVVLTCIAIIIFIGIILQIKYVVDKQYCYDLPLTDFYKDDTCEKFRRK